MPVCTSASIYLRYTCRYACMHTGMLHVCKHLCMLAGMHDMPTYPMYAGPTTFGYTLRGNQCLRASSSLDGCPGDQIRSCNGCFVTAAVPITFACVKELLERMYQQVGSTLAVSLQLSLMTCRGLFSHRGTACVVATTDCGQHSGSL